MLHHPNEGTKVARLGDRGRRLGRAARQEVL